MTPTHRPYRNPALQHCPCGKRAVAIDGAGPVCRHCQAIEASNKEHERAAADCADNIGHFRPTPVPMLVGGGYRVGRQ